MLVFSCFSFGKSGTLIKTEVYIKDKKKLFLEYDVFLLVTQAYSDKVKKNPSAPNRSRTYDLPISTSDALPLS